MWSDFTFDFPVLFPFFFSYMYIYSFTILPKYHFTDKTTCFQRAMDPGFWGELLLFAGEFPLVISGTLVIRKQQRQKKGGGIVRSESRGPGSPSAAQV